MAADRIAVNRSKQAGNHLVRMAELISEVQGLAKDLSNIAGHGIDGTDRTVMESDFGLAGGAGANVATLITTMHDLFNTSNTVGDGSAAARLSVLNEVVGRLARQ